MQMARWRITDQLRKRRPVSAPSSADADGTARTPTVERARDWREVDLAELCDAEWWLRLGEEAVKQLQFEVKAEHYQIFPLITVEQKSPLEVARMLGRNRAPNLASDRPGAASGVRPGRGSLWLHLRGAGAGHSRSQETAGQPPGRSRAKTTLGPPSALEDKP
jgi:hypothetical protein